MSKTARHIMIGRQGEDIVAWALRQRGFRLIDRNVRTRFGEIDLIVQKGVAVVFVEVKTRTSAEYGFPEEAVDNRKRLHLERSCLALSRRYAGSRPWSILIVAVSLDLAGKKAHLRSLELTS